MAAASILPAPKQVRSSFIPVIQGSPIEMLGTDNFNPKKHIDFTPPSKVYTMRELHFPENVGVSPIAVSSPFPLFTSQAIHRMRAEILSEAVWDNCQYSSNLAQCQLRGFAPE